MIHRFVLRSFKLMLLRVGLYNGVARLGFYLRNYFMWLQMIGSDTHYFFPRAPQGEHKAQFGQDFYLEKLGLLEEDGFFIDIGCNHPRRGSNTYYLETVLGWSGVAVDGIDFSAEYESSRPKTTYLNFLVDPSSSRKCFYKVHDVEGWENQISSVNEGVLRIGKGFESTVMELECIRIDKIKRCERNIDLCSIDVEGHEIEVLETIDWQRFPPRVFVIENNAQFRPRRILVDYMEQKNYTHVARIGPYDDIFVRRDP